MSIQENLKRHGKIRYILEDINTGKKTISPWMCNIITVTGKNAMARGLCNEGLLANEGQITYGAIGNGSITSVSDTDTTLSAEISRKAISASSVSGITARLSVFYDTSEANGTITEFGWFGEDAGAGADSGTMFNHIVMSVTKTSNETLTIEGQITFA